MKNLKVPHDHVNDHGHNICLITILTVSDNTSHILRNINTCIFILF